MCDDTSISGGVSINIDHAEALVLFDFLSRELDEYRGERIRDFARSDGELWALNSLLSGLEREVAEALHPEYDKLLERATASLERKYGPWPK